MSVVMHKEPDACPECGCENLWIYKGNANCPLCGWTDHDE